MPNTAKPTGKGDGMNILAIGEAMVELAPIAPDGPEIYRVGFAGDTLNTAWYLRQLCPTDWQIGFLSRLGQDVQSTRMQTFITEAGLYMPPVPPHPTRTPGLYLISLNKGERSFSYWRETSAARTLMEEPATIQRAIAAAGSVFLSGITLAILSPADRRALLAMLASTRVIFDPNFRPNLWPDRQEARDVFTQVAALCEILLPSFDDEALLFGDANPAATAQRYAAAGATEVVVKNGAAQGALWHGGVGSPLPAPDTVTPVDTTGAGDSFNAGYLSERLAGASPLVAVAKGQEVARRVVSHHGALARL